MDIPARSLVFCCGNSTYFVIVFLILTAVVAVPVYQSTYLLVLNSTFPKTSARGQAVS